VGWRPQPGRRLDLANARLSFAPLAVKVLANDTPAALMNNYSRPEAEPFISPGHQRDHDRFEVLSFICEHILAVHGVR
jgi:hypothetical protein